MSLVPLSPRLRPRHTAGPIFIMPGNGASPASGLCMSGWGTQQSRRSVSSTAEGAEGFEASPPSCRAGSIAAARRSPSGGEQKLTRAQRRQPLPSGPLALGVGDQRHLARRLQHDGRHAALPIQQLVHVRLHRRDVMPASVQLHQRRCLDTVWSTCAWQARGACFDETGAKRCIRIAVVASGSSARAGTAAGHRNGVAMDLGGITI